MKIEHRITMTKEEKEQVVNAFVQLHGPKFGKDLNNNKIPGMSMFLTKDSNNYMFIVDNGEDDVNNFVAGILNAVEITKAAEEIVANNSSKN